MRRNEQDRINYFRNKFDRWYYTTLSFSPKEKRSFIVVALIFCIAILLFLPSISSEFEDKKFWVWIIALIAFSNILFLLYENFKERDVIPPSSSFTSEFPCNFNRKSLSRLYAEKS